jgi:hypothetical protein
MTTTARHTTSTRLLLAAVLAVVAALALGARTAGAVTSASLQATDKCWLDVVNDWLDNSQVDRTYAIPCYTQAIQHLSQFPDVSGYSSAEDDIHNALLAAIRQDRGGGGGSFGGGSPSGPDGNSDSGTKTVSSSSGKPGDSSSGPLTTGIDHIGPSDATSVPLPLIVLAGLALLLLLAAGGTWLARRIQSRRMHPAPAPIRRS